KHGDVLLFAWTKCQNDRFFSFGSRKLWNSNRVRCRWRIQKIHNSDSRSTSSTDQQYLTYIWSLTGMRPLKSTIAELVCPLSLSTKAGQTNIPMGMSQASWLLKPKFSKQIR